MIKRIVTVSVVIIAIAVVLIAVYANRNISLYEAIDNPELYPMSGANVTSLKKLSEENSFVYQLTDDEVERLQEILSVQQVSRSYFGNDQLAEFEFAISLDGDTISEMIHFHSDGKLAMASANRYYTLESDELTDFMADIFDQQGDF